MYMKYWKHLGYTYYNVNLEWISTENINWEFHKSNWKLIEIQILILNKGEIVKNDLLIFKK